MVNGKIYDGQQNYMPHRQFSNIGDTCEVVYANSNPEISRLLTDDNDFLRIRRNKKESSTFFKKIKFFQRKFLDLLLV